MFQITPTIKQITETVSYLAINIVLLAFYASQPDLADSDIGKYRGLSIAGNVFMMIGYLLIIFMHFKYIFYVALGIIVTMNFGVFLLLIGMGMGANYLDKGNFNTGIAFWFIQLAIDILGMQVLLKIYKDNQGEQDVKGPKQNNDTNNAANNASQPQVQL